MLRERFDSDPRVVVEPAAAALDAFPASPFHVTLPATPALRPGLVLALRIAVGGLAMVDARLTDGSHASIAHAWALNRARRTRRPVAEFGDVLAVRLPPRGLTRLATLCLGDPHRALNAPRSRRVRAVARLFRLRRVGKRLAETSGVERDLHDTGGN